MYSFELTEEQQMLVEAVGKYAANDLRVVAREAEEGGELPKKLVGKGWEIGLLQASIPESYGGFGERSAVTGVLALEEMAFGDLAGGLAVMTPSLFATPILLAGSEEQRLTYLPKIVEGNWSPYSAALIEYALDFDPNALRTRATVSGDHFILNGEKAFVPFAPQAEAILVYADLNGVTQGFIIPKGLEGMSISEEREKLMSLNALPLYRLKLENVKVPVANRLGGEPGHPFEPVLAPRLLADMDLDDKIGRLIQALKDTGQFENTVIVYTSDHGEMAGEHGLWWKNSFYEQASRVPIIFSWSGRIQSNQRFGGAIGIGDHVGAAGFGAHLRARSAEALEQLRRIGHEGYPVIEGGKVVGLLTRRDADRALEHNLTRATVRDVSDRDDGGLEPRPGLIGDRPADAGAN